MTETTVLNEPVDNAPSNVVEPREHNENPSANAHKEQEAPEVNDDKPKKPESRLDTIKRAAADIEKANGKTEDKPKEGKEPEGEKPKVETESKAPAEKQEGKTAQENTAALKQPESRRANDEAPARFLQKAKEQWLSAPREVRQEVSRITQEYDREIETHRQAKASWDELADYDARARQSGTTLKQAVTQYVAMEDAFRSDPANGFRALMGNLQIGPVQAIGHVLRAAGVSPQQLMQHMSQNPNEYTALASQPVRQQQVQQPQEQRVDPNIQQLQDRIAHMEAERVADSIIRPFAEEHPEYYQHEGAIAEVLKSGIIERIHGNGLSPRDKLEAALQMVASRPSQPRIDNAPVHNQAASPPVQDDVRGGKSVKGAPSPGFDNSQRRGKMSRTQALDAAWAELGLR